MRRIGFLLLLGAILLLEANPLFGLEESDQNQIRIGIGIPFGKRIVLADDGDLVLQSASLSNVYLPIVIQSQFRLEPEFGLWRYSYSRKNSTEYTSNCTSLRLGCGFFLVRPKENVHLSGGVRFGFTFTSSKEDWESDYQTGEEASKTDFFIGPAIGGEYFFSKHFSIGGEAQINYIAVGEWKYKDDDDDDDIDRSESIITNNTLVFLRWYY